MRREFAEEILCAAGYELKDGTWCKPPVEEHEWKSLDDADLDTPYGRQLLRFLHHRTLAEDG